MLSRRAWMRYTIITTTMHCILQYYLVGPTTIQCPGKTYFQVSLGQTTSSQCRNTTSAINQSMCLLECAKDLGCLTFKYFCITTCTCQICNSIEDLDLKNTDHSFLRRREIMYSVAPQPNQQITIWLIGGLYSGHIMEFLFLLEEPYDNKLLVLTLTTPTDSFYDGFALSLNMDMISGEATPSSLVNGQQDPENGELSFQFQKTSEFHIVIFTNSSGFSIFINSQLYCHFRHRVTALDTIQYLNVQPYTVSSLRRLSFWLLCMPISTHGDRHATFRTCSDTASTHNTFYTVDIQWIYTLIYLSIPHILYATSYINNLHIENYTLKTKRHLPVFRLSTSQTIPHTLYFKYHT